MDQGLFINMSLSYQNFIQDIMHRISFRRVLLLIGVKHQSHQLAEQLASAQLVALQLPFDKDCELLGSFEFHFEQLGVWDGFLHLMVELHHPWQLSWEGHKILSEPQ